MKTIRRQKDRFIFIPLMLILLMTVTMCNVRLAHGRSRGKLSEAMGKASEENKKGQDAPTEWEDHSHGNKDSAGRSCLSSCLGLPFDLFLDIFLDRTPSEETQWITNEEFETLPDIDEPEFSGTKEETTKSSEIEPQRHSESEPSQNPSQASTSLKRTVENSYGDAQGDAFLVFNGGFGAIKGEDFHALYYLQIGLGAYIEEHSRFEVYVGGAWASVKETSNLDKSITDAVGLITVGGHLKYFFTPRYAFLGPYVLAGLAYNQLFWSYENPIYYENETIQADDLSGFELHIGAGLSIMPSHNFQIGLEVVPSFFIWGPTTSEGFENDVFGPFSSVQFRTTLTYLF